MKNAIETLLIILCCVVSSQAQNITVNEDPIISKMMVLFTGTATTPASATPTNGTVNPPLPTTGTTTTEAPQVLDGFRIQIMASTDRRQVEAGQGVFTTRYPGTFAVWQQAKPYYRLRVGGFSSRSDATRYLQSIRKDYPDAYIVPDKVKTNEITN